DTYATALHGYCWSILRNDDAAMDAMQETFIVAFERVDRLRSTQLLRPWLFMLARNSCLRQTREARRRRQPAPATLAAAAAPAHPPEGAEPEDLPATVWIATESLSRLDREILELSLRQGLDDAELAAVLGVRQSRTRTLLARARKRFEDAVVA